VNRRKQERPEEKISIYVKTAFIFGNFVALMPKGKNVFLIFTFL
jgi:hypothetical protein